VTAGCELWGLLALTPLWQRHGQPDGCIQPAPEDLKRIALIRVQFATPKA
jgi:hypothetical protein